MNHRSLAPRALVLLVTWFALSRTTAQNYHYDFEGPNGLDGWHLSNGQPLQTDVGLASSTSVRIQSSGDQTFLYHQIPYDPNMRYSVTLWFHGTGQANARVHTGWVDMGTFLTNSNASSSGGSTTSWQTLDYPPRYPLPQGTWTGAVFCMWIDAWDNQVENVWIDDVSVELIPTSEIVLQMWVYLGGCFVSTETPMHDQLGLAGLIPSSEPYTAFGYAQFGGGGETCMPGLLDQSIYDDAVDWVRIELRSANNPSQIVATRQAMVDRIGRVRGMNGGRYHRLSVAAGNYFVAVRHRNHLGAMTSAAVSFTNVQGAWPVVDFRTASTATWGTNARNPVDATHMLLWPGNTSGDGMIKYTGSANDRDPILTAVGSTTPSNAVTGYFRTDVNLNGVTKYTGTANDRDPILLNVGSTTPNNTRLEQLP